MYDVNNFFLKIPLRKGGSKYSEWVCYMPSALWTTCVQRNKYQSTITSLLVSMQNIVNSVMLPKALIILKSPRIWNYISYYIYYSIGLRFSPLHFPNNPCFKNKKHGPCPSLSVIYFTCNLFTRLHQRVKVFLRSGNCRS